MDNGNDYKFIDPNRIAVSASETEENNAVKQINAANNNVMRGYPGNTNNTNLKPKVSNSLNESKNIPNDKDSNVRPNNNTRNQNFRNNLGNGKNAQANNNLRNQNFRNNTAPNANGKNKNNAASDLKRKVAKAAMGMAGIHGKAADTVLDAQQSRNMLANRKGLFSRLSSNFMRNRRQIVADQSNDGGGTLHVSGTMKKIILISSLVPVLTFGLVMFMSLFVVFAILNNLSMDPETVMNSSSEKINKKLNGADEDTDPIKGAEDMAKDGVAYTIISNNNSIYTIKLSKASVLDAKATTDTYDDKFGFNIESIDSLYPSASSYSDVPYSYAFFYKLKALNDYYTELCGKQILNLPLLMITLNEESEDMSDVFASNIGVREGILINKEYMDTTFNKNVFAYNYDWSNYVYYKNSSLHDMEILAQHMVKVYGDSYCKYDEEGYKEFLKEFIEKKYYLSTDSGDRLSPNPNSSNYFQKYNLTEDQLIQIASLCGQEQGHSNPRGAAAEASLMANKFEISGGEYSKQYPNNGDALYHYVRGTGKPEKDWWWHKAPKYMDERRVIPEVLEAVRDVLVNGNRTLPKYVVSHDCYDCNRTRNCPSGIRGDICEVTTNGVTHTDLSYIKNKSNYVPHNTRVKNVYSSASSKGAIFYSFPSSAGDPFSYKDEKLRAKVGECHYDPDKKAFVECVDFRNVLVKWAVNIANDDSHGYSQAKRNSLIDFDCSSLVYYSLINSGFSTTQLGSKPFTTATERDILKRNGFTEVSVNADGSNLQVGDILWKQGHTEIYIGEGMTVGAHAASNETAEDNQAGDQNGKEIAVVNIVKNGYWTYAYRYGN
ncbi:MAG: hypothetical protein J6W64_04285 [Bacilli bacterium]|nr:hypothetical protein [Bacilli bacterium]